VCRSHCEQTLNAGALKMLSHPRILFIGESVPYGPVHGGGSRTRVTIEALARVGRVTFLPIIRRPWGVDAVAEAECLSTTIAAHFDDEIRKRLVN
jgi:hypothetical protein